MPLKKKTQKADSMQSHHSKKMKTKNQKEISHMKLNMAAALKKNNQSLAAALDDAKKEYRKVKEENLGLKQERQQLLERVAGLESKVLEGQTQQSLAAVEPAVKLLVQAQRKIEQAKENLRAISDQPVSIALSPIVDISRPNKPQVRFEETSDLQRTSPLRQRIVRPNTPHPLLTNKSIGDEGPPLTSTPVRMQSQSPLTPVAPCAIRFSDSESMSEIKGVSPTVEGRLESSEHSPRMPESGNGSNFEEHSTFTELESNLLGRRPKRRCTSLSVSYQQPSLHKKLRRGDPFTENSTDWSPPNQKQKRKKKATTINKISGIKQQKALQERKVLQELTNH